MLGAHLAVDAFVRPLEHRPEALDSVGVGLAVDELSDRVIHGFMVKRHALTPEPAVVSSAGLFQYAAQDPNGHSQN